MNLYVSYLIIIAGILLTALLFVNKNPDKPAKYMGVITIFGGAFLLAVCFLNLAPHVYDTYHINEGCLSEHSHFSLKIGIFILIGFLIQLLLEAFTKGTEHGHFHGVENPDCYNKITVFPLLIGISLHAFLEGMPITHDGKEVQVGLVLGIFIHNIPIAILLLTLFQKAHFSKWRTFLFLALFAIMTPLGSVVKNTLLSGLTNFESIITAIVIGILLHVAVSILFFDENTQKNKTQRIVIILIAFIFAYLLPSCTH